MIEVLTVHGFGSFFKGALNPGDVDLLLLHRSTEAKSCRFAIQCKRQLQAALPGAHIVMLSEAEATSHCFLGQADTVQLCTVHEDKIESDIDAVIVAIRMRRGSSRD